MPWTRLDYEKLADKNVGGHDSSPCLRVYGEDGKEWPRLILDIMGYSPYGSGYFKIACSRKDDPECWWGESEIPLELANDVKAIIDEYVGSERVNGIE